MVNKIDLNTVKSFSQEEKFLIDTNVLLKVLIYPELFQGSANPYDSFWEFALTHGLKLFVTPLTISEFVNVICREKYKTYMEMNGFNGKYFKFKGNYQKTKEFKEVYSDCLNAVEDDILPHIEVINADKELLSSLAIYDNLMKDYNDLIYYALAKKMNLSIITHDSDFLEIKDDINVYTYL